MKKSCFVLPLLFFATAIFAQELPLTVTLTTDGAYLPESKYRTGDSHFSPIDGIYHSAKLRSTLVAAYKIPVLVDAENPLFAGNNVTLYAGGEVTPVSVMPQVSVSFSPAAMLEFAAGGMAGTAWSFGSFQGIAEYCTATDENGITTGAYENLSAFRSWYLYGWARATVQFDAAALWPGDWHHIVAQAQYTVGYETMTGTSADVWNWCTINGYADGWVYQQYYALGYQMPCRVSMVAVTATLSGHFNGDDYGQFAQNYDGGFMTVEIAPTVECALTPKDDVYVVLNVNSRRSFAQPHTEEDEEPLLTKTGREWFFDYIALRWVHRF